MGNKLYVGNLPYTTRDDDIQQAFSPFGTVASAKVMIERDSGRSRGFAFVEMSSEAEAHAAIEGLHGQPFAGRDLVVNEAKPQEARPARPASGRGGRY
jgi:RNA recognition motif-containing protein